MIIYCSIILALAGQALGCGTLLRKQHRMDVGKNTSGCDGDATEQLVQLLVVLHGQCDMTGHDACLLVIAGGIPGQFENFGGQVFEHGREVDGGAGAHAGGIFALSQETTDATDGELQTGLGRCRGGFLLAASSFSFSCVCVCLTVGYVSLRLRLKLKVQKKCDDDESRATTGESRSEWCS